MPFNIEVEKVLVKRKGQVWGKMFLRYLRRVCLKMGYTPQTTYFSGEHDRTLLDSEVHERNPFGGSTNEATPIAGKFISWKIRKT